MQVLFWLATRLPVTVLSSAVAQLPLILNTVGPGQPILLAKLKESLFISLYFYGLDATANLGVLFTFSFYLPKN